MRPISVAYGLVGCFLAVERWMRQGAAARSMQEGPADRGSTRAVGATFGLALVALLLAPLLNRLKIGRFGSEAPAWGGIVAMLAGLGLRVWATRVLGAFYTRTLRTDAAQPLITAGPYRHVRHPGYLGTLLLWLGAGVASANAIVALLIAVSFAYVYRYRISAEEAMLAEAFPQAYPGYARRTWRLIPLIY